MGTRHNVGFEVVDTLARRHKTRIARRLGRVLVARATINGREVILAKPQTYMNLSGEAVAYIARREKIDPSEILIVYDDMALQLGRIRIRPEGSSGGHKGMKSIIERLGTQEFPRLRVGIGSADRGAVEHVLSKFSRNEVPIAREAVQRAADAVETILGEGIEPAMNLYNSPH
ncbi:MAG: aminoacyl-tRNA hydrolase [Armatimonadetes bacterium]|nr:aminoacyl-tRNA hydrolase [Armatimonadota bacterium]